MAHTLVYVLGEKFDVQKLKIIAGKFTKFFILNSHAENKKRWDIVFTSVSIADKYKTTLASKTEMMGISDNKSDFIKSLREM